MGFALDFFFLLFYLGLIFLSPPLPQKKQYLFVWLIENVDVVRLGAGMHDCDYHGTMAFRLLRCCSFSLGRGEKGPGGRLGLVCV